SAVTTKSISTSLRGRSRFSRWTCWTRRTKAMFTSVFVTGSSIWSIKRAASSQYRRVPGWFMVLSPCVSSEDAVVSLRRAREKAGTRLSGSSAPHESRWYRADVEDRSEYCPRNVHRPERCCRRRREQDSAFQQPLWLTEFVYPLLLS